MGIWDFGLYDNDITADIKDSFQELLEQDIAAKEIRSIIKEEYADLLSDPHEGLIATLALYDQLLDCGSLTKAERSKALEIISKIEQEECWINVSQEFLSGRRNELARIREKFQTVENKKPSPRKKIKTIPWEVGQLYALPITMERAVAAGVPEIGNEYILIYVNGYQIEDKRDAHFWVKLTENRNLPKNVEDFNRLPFVQVCSTDMQDRFGPFRYYENVPKAFQQEYRPDKWNELPEFTLKIFDAKRRQPPVGLLYLGIYSGVTPPEYEYFRYPFPVGPVWKYAEEYILKYYRIFTLKKAPRYNKQDR